jgi:hypothetical protein
VQTKPHALILTAVSSVTVILDMLEMALNALIWMSVLWELTTIAMRMLFVVTPLAATVALVDLDTLAVESPVLILTSA